MGQPEDVIVNRLTAKDTIVRRCPSLRTCAISRLPLQEERVLALQKRKAFYSDGALHEGQVSRCQRRNIADLRADPKLPDQFKSGAPRHTLSVPELLGLFRLGPNGERLQKGVVGGGRPGSPGGSFG